MTDGFPEEQHESIPAPADEDRTTAIATAEPVPDVDTDPRPRALLLGSDGLSGELATALGHLGANVTVADASHDADELSRTVQRVRPNVVVATTETVAPGVLDALAAGTTDLVPSARALRLTADREGLRRLAADELGLPTAPFWFVGSEGELQAVATHAGFPLVVKPVTGRGQSVISGPDDVALAWKRETGANAAGPGAGQHRLLAEAVVEVEFHVTLLAVGTEGPRGPVIEFCSPIGHREDGADVLESWQPQKMSPAATDAAKSIAARIVKALGGRGVYGVELMINGDEVYFADVTPLPRRTAWVTVRSQRLSSFELLARTILRLPVDTMMISPAAARSIDRRDPPSSDALIGALGVPESDLRAFGRNLYALATAPEVATARERAREVAGRLNVRDSRG